MNPFTDFYVGFFSLLRRLRKKRESFHHPRRTCICGKRIALTRDGKFYKHICNSSGPVHFELHPDLSTITQNEMVNLIEEAKLAEQQAIEEDQQDGRR